MGQVPQGPDQTTEAVISVADLDKCPYCDSLWKYTIECTMCEGEGCECCKNGQRGPYSLLMGIEYPYGHPDRYDGVSEWKCPSCDARWGRWTGKVLKANETELRYGGKQK